VGDFAEDRIHGEGKFYHLSGKVIHGRWIKGFLAK
jgi:hypothetical protein